MVKIRGKIDLRKKNAVTRFKRNTENYPRKCFWVYPADIAIHLLNNWGTDTSVSRLNVTNATRDVQRVPVSRLPRAPQQPRHCYATLRVSPSRAPVLSFGHYWLPSACYAGYSDLTWNASYGLGVRCREERTFFEWWTSTGSEFFAFLVSGFALIF